MGERSADRGHVTDADGGHPGGWRDHYQGGPIGYRQRLDIIGSLPGMLADLQHHRIAALTPREPIRRVAAP